MRTMDPLLILIVLHVQVVLGITYGNTTSGSASSTPLVTAGPTTSSLSASTEANEPVCCSIFIDFVGINSWYSGALEYVAETVITKYLAYNNTVVPTITTVYNNATPTYLTEVANGYTYPSLSGIPTGLVEGGDGDYPGTVVVPSTVWTDDYTSL